MRLRMMVTPVERQRAHYLANLAEIAHNEPHIRKALERASRSGIHSDFSSDPSEIREPTTRLGGFMLMWLATIVHGGKTIWRVA